MFALKYAPSWEVLRKEVTVEQTKKPELQHSTTFSNLILLICWLLTMETANSCYKETCSKEELFSTIQLVTLKWTM